jgi:hypothetical protein
MGQTERNTSLAKQMNTALFWALTQRVVVICYLRFGTTYRSHLREKQVYGMIGCTETSVRKYHYSLCNSPEERSSDWLVVWSRVKRQFAKRCLSVCFINWRCAEFGGVVSLMRAQQRSRCADSSRVQWQRGQAAACSLLHTHLAGIRPFCNYTYCPNIVLICW